MQLILFPGTTFVRQQINAKHYWIFFKRCKIIKGFNESDKGDNI